MKPADLVLFSDAVFDSVHDEPFPGAVVISGNRIEYVGSKKTAERYIGYCTEVRDCEDRLILPGFCDGHAHLTGTIHGAVADVVNLLGYKSEEECARRVAEYAAEHPKLKRINGIGWYMADWDDLTPPTRKSLDKYLPDIPVFLNSADGHCSWLNTAALEACKMEEYLKKYPTSEQYAPRDAEGHLTGFLGAGPSGYSLMDSQNYPPDLQAEYTKRFLKMLGRYGITAITEATLMRADGLAKSYRQIKALENQDALTARFYVWPGFGPEAEGAPEVAKFKDYEHFFNTDKLHIVGIKSVVDGVTTDYSAYELHPYADRDDGYRGKPVAPPERFLQWVTAVNALGYPIKFHAIGDAAVRLALDSFEASGKANDLTNIRNAIEHAEAIDDADLPRFKSTGTIASVQPAHVILDNGYGQTRLGMDYFKREWRFRDLINAGAAMAFGTDSPVVELNPYLTIYKAVTRMDENGNIPSPYTMDQVLTLAEVLKGYTSGTAYANNMETKVGTLEAGKYADVIVADRNLFAIPPRELKDCKTVLTVFDGKIVYEA